ncbi:MAG: hypothetical protein OES57_19085 [Acidimicrobiia bacterium]|nr:hypothetical protein [Acidimicrobiia bacterium]
MVEHMAVGAEDDSAYLRGDVGIEHFARCHDALGVGRFADPSGGPGDAVLAGEKGHLGQKRRVVHAQGDHPSRGLARRGCGCRAAGHLVQGIGASLLGGPGQIVGGGGTPRSVLGVGPVGGELDVGEPAELVVEFDACRRGQVGIEAVHAVEAGRRVQAALLVALVRSVTAERVVGEVDPVAQRSVELGERAPSSRHRPERSNARAT